jgi:hypothetical protein
VKQSEQVKRAGFGHTDKIPSKPSPLADLLAIVVRQRYLRMTTLQ